MSVEKGEMRTAVIDELGGRVDDMLEQSQLAAARADGAAHALEQAAEIVRTLHSHIDRELNEGKITELDQAQLAKQWITRAVHALNALAQQASTVKTIQKGHAQGIASVVSLLKRTRDTELRQVEEHRNRETRADDDDLPIKAQRLAEEAAEAAAEVAVATEAIAASPPASVSGRPRPRRRRKAAASDGTNA